MASLTSSSAGCCRQNFLNGALAFQPTSWALHSNAACLRRDLDVELQEYAHDWKTSQSALKWIGPRDLVQWRDGVSADVLVLKQDCSQGPGRGALDLLLRLGAELHVCHVLRNCLWAVRLRQ